MTSQPSLNPVGVMMQSTETMLAYSCIFNYIPTGSGFDFTPPVDLSAALGSLNDAFAGPLQDLEDAVSGANLTSDLASAYQSLMTFFSDILDNPPGLYGKAVPDFLSAVGDFVDVALDLLDVVAEVVLDLLEQMLGGLEEVLTHPLDIPLLSWLYKQMQSGTGQPAEDMTILGLCALLLAAPVTSMYKAANDMQAPFTDEDVSTILAWDFPTPGQPAARAPLAGAGATTLLPPAVKTAAKVLIGLLAVPQAFFDFVLDSPYEDAQTRTTSSATFMKVFGWCDVVNASLIQLMGIPDYEDWFSDEAHTWVESVWIAGWILPGINAASLTPPVQASARGQDWGKVALSIGGAALIGTGIAAASVGMGATPPITNGWDIATAILAPMSNTLEFFVLEPVVDATYTWSFWLKLFVDEYADVAAGVTQGLG